MSNLDNKLFARREHALEKAQGTCPDCQADLVVKHGKTGAFFGCSNYPNCQFTRPVAEQTRVEDKVLANTECPLCQAPLAVKQGRYGMFIGCSDYPQCHHIEETHHQDEVGIACPQCQKHHRQGQLFEKTNRFGKTFYACDNYPSCKYVLNYTPVAQECPQCQWPVLIQRHMANGDVLMCPEKKCSYKSKAL